MKTLENISSQNWWDKALNRWPLLIDTDSVHTLVAIAWGVKIADRWRWSPVLCDDGSLFYNGILFVRIAFPFWIGLHIRWAGRNIYRREYFQFGLGWKLNGRIALLLRVQSDAQSSMGHSGPNYTQAWGWENGAK